MEHITPIFQQFLRLEWTLYLELILSVGGPVSVVGSSDWLRAGRFGDPIPVGARFSTPVQTGPGAQPASCTMGTGSFLGIKSVRGVTLTLHLLVPWARKGRAIALFPLWAVQGLSACTRVHFTFILPPVGYCGPSLMVCSNFCYWRVPLLPSASVNCQDPFLRKSPFPNVQEFNAFNRNKAILQEMSVAQSRLTSQ